MYIREAERIVSEVAAGQLGLNGGTPRIEPVFSIGMALLEPTKLRVEDRDAIERRPRGCRPREMKAGDRAVFAEAGCGMSKDPVMIPDFAEILDVGENLLARQQTFPEKLKFVCGISEFWIMLLGWPGPTLLQMVPAEVGSSPNSRRHDGVPGRQEVT